LAGYEQTAWTESIVSAKNSDSGILRSKDRLNFPEPDDLQPGMTAGQ
jgi:hypothetical protein